MFNERYFSNLHNMIIPLYGFNHYHSASNCEENTEGFIGRDSIIDKLSAWLDAQRVKRRILVLISSQAIVEWEKVRLCIRLLLNLVLSHMDLLRK